jgi:Holliday junction resolvase RusA-like endonuclease
LIERLELTGRVPSKKNNKVKAKNGIFSSADHQRWNKTAVMLFKSQTRLRDIEECRVKIHFTFGTRAKADLTNKAESIMDALVDAGILVDDNYMVVNKVELSGEYVKNVFKSEIEIDF